VKFIGTLFWNSNQILPVSEPPDNSDFRGYSIAVMQWDKI